MGDNERSRSGHPGDPGIRRIGETADMLGEGPVWCPETQALYWVDIKAPALRRWSAADGTTTWPMPEFVGSLALCQGGGILVALTSGPAVFDPDTGAFRRLATPVHDGADMRFNDGKCDPQGRFWVGTMSDPGRSTRGKLYCLGHDGALATVLDGIDIPNSLCWSPDGATMYFSDSTQHTTWTFSFDGVAGTLGPRRVFRKTEFSAPDGATVDEEGYFWCAEYGGWRITRSAPDGTLDRVIELPVQQATSCAFGGPDLSTLFITNARQHLTEDRLAEQPLAGALLAIDVGVRGRPEPRYRGP